MKSKQGKTAQLRCKCIRITDKATGEVVSTYYVLNGMLYGFIEGLVNETNTRQFMGWFGGYKSTIQKLKLLYRKGYKVQVFMYDQSKLDWPHKYW